MAGRSRKRSMSWRVVELAGASDDDFYAEPRPTWASSWPPTSPRARARHDEADLAGDRGGAVPRPGQCSRRAETTGIAPRTARELATVAAEPGGSEGCTTSRRGAARPWHEIGEPYGEAQAPPSRGGAPRDWCARRSRPNYEPRPRSPMRCGPRRCGTGSAASPAERASRLRRTPTPTPWWQTKTLRVRAHAASVRSSRSWPTAARTGRSRPSSSSARDRERARLEHLAKLGVGNRAEAAAVAPGRLAG